MILRRFISRETAANCILGIGGISFAAVYASNAFLGHRYARLYQAYGVDGNPIPIRRTIEVQLDGVLSNLGYTEWNKKFFHPFVCKNLEPKVIGSTKVKNGVFIGVPHYYQAISEEEIKNSNILINGEPVDWDSADGDRLLKALKLSDNAIKFLLAKLSLEADNYKMIIDSLIPMVLLTTYYAVAQYAYSAFNLLHKPIASSIFVYSSLGLVFFFIYLFMKDGITVSYEKSADEKIYGLNESYIVGGIEYYQAILERNKALRNLMKNGHKRYSVLGNETSIIRTKGLPITFKLKIANEFLELNYQKQYAAEIPTPRKPQPIM